MIISLSSIIDRYNLCISGVIHIGANDGAEYKDYSACGIKDMIFFEPITANFNELIKNIPLSDNIITFNYALGNEVGTREMYVETVNKGQSCSLLEPSAHLHIYPKIKFNKKERVAINKLDNIPFNCTKYNMINIDVQGYELEVFKGAVETLKSIDIIYTEVNFQDLYKGCCRAEDLDTFLEGRGFMRVLTEDKYKKECGWGDALYLRTSVYDIGNLFDVMARKSFQFEQRAYEGDPNWGMMRRLFQRNFIEHGVGQENVIPRKIHQIWLGGEMPDRYKQWADTWKIFNPTWEYKLWMDKDVATMELPNRDLFDSMTNYGPKSDLLRYHLLNTYGGLYVDTDFECLKSFDDLTYLNFFTSVAYPAKLELYPGLIGCTAHHPIIEKAVEGVCNIRNMPTDGNGVLETISSYFFTRIFLQNIREYAEGVVAFPTDYFYPFPNTSEHPHKNGRDYIKKCSYAVHHWAVSWLK